MHPQRRLEERWPILTDLEALDRFLRRFEDPTLLSVRAVLEGAFRFAQSPDGDAVPVRATQTQLRGMDLLNAEIPRCPALFLVDSDTGQAIFGPATMDWDASPPRERGHALVHGSTRHSHYVRFDARGLHLERDGQLIFMARRVTQVVAEDHTRFVDRDSGAAVRYPGFVARQRPAPVDAPAHLHVETRPFPGDYLQRVRDELTALIRGALDSGPPILWDNA